MTLGIQGPEFPYVLLEQECKQPSPLTPGFSFQGAQKELGGYRVPCGQPVAKAGTRLCLLLFLMGAPRMVTALTLPNTRTARAKPTT